MLKNKLCLIVAMSKDSVIGDNGRLPWGRLSGDLSYFRDITDGYPIIMGRKTHESIGRILPGRMNIVITNNPASIKTEENLRVFSNPMEAIRFADGLNVGEPSRLFIIGGGEIYRFFFPMVDELYINHIKLDCGGDTYFPEFDQTEWINEYTEEFDHFTATRLVRKPVLLSNYAS